jgi:hypothetical protein
VRVQVGDIDAPGDRRLDLSPAFGARAFRIDSLEGFPGCGREEAFVIMKRSSVCQAALAISAVFGGQRQVHANRKALEHAECFDLAGSRNG